MLSLVDGCIFSDKIPVLKKASKTDVSTPPPTPPLNTKVNLVNTIDSYRNKKCKFTANIYLQSGQKRTFLNLLPWSQ